MKAFFLMSSLLLATSLVGCSQTKSVAGTYKEKIGGGDASAEGDTTTKGDASGAGDTSTEGDTTTGDVEKGNVYLDTQCVLCHTSGGAAASVTLDETAVSRLDTALTGPNKAYHTSLKAFTDGRADLEAALNAKTASLLLHK